MAIGLRLGLGFALPVLLGILATAVVADRDLAFSRRLSLVLAVEVGLARVAGASVLYMRPRKRGEVEDQIAGEEDLIKKTRAESLISSAVVDEEHMAANEEVMELDGVNGSNGVEIDEDLHSRQLAVYGRETMRRLFASNILVSGIQGLGIEIAKNLVLAGVKSVTLHDEADVELWDLSTNFFFSEDDIGKNRATACVQKLQELNNAVLVSTLSSPLTKEQLSSFQRKYQELVRITYKYLTLR